MTDKQPEALRLADELCEAIAEYPEPTALGAQAAAELRTQHARITELEAQLAQRFDAADMATAAAQGFRDGVASLTAQAAESVTEPAGVEEGDIDAVALARYKVVPAHESMIHRFAVVAGDGNQQLYLGREVECENMTRKFAGAFLDGAFYQSKIAAAPTPAAQSADSVQEDAARLDFLIDQRAYVVSDPDACPGHWLHWSMPDGSTWVQGDEHPTPRAAIDAARKQGATK